MPRALAKQERSALKDAGFDFWGHILVHPFPRDDFQLERQTHSAFFSGVSRCKVLCRLAAFVSCVVMGGFVCP